MFLGIISYLSKKSNSYKTIKMEATDVKGIIKTLFALKTDITGPMPVKEETRKTAWFRHSL